MAARLPPPASQPSRPQPQTLGPAHLVHIRGQGAGHELPHLPPAGPARRRGKAGRKRVRARVGQRQPRARGAPCAGWPQAPGGRPPPPTHTGAHRGSASGRCPSAPLPRSASEATSFCTMRRADCSGRCCSVLAWSAPKYSSSAVHRLRVQRGARAGCQLAASPHRVGIRPSAAPTRPATPPPHMTPPPPPTTTATTHTSTGTPPTHPPAPPAPPPAAAPGSRASGCRCAPAPGPPPPPCGPAGASRGPRWKPAGACCFISKFGVGRAGVGGVGGAGGRAPCIGQGRGAGGSWARSPAAWARRRDKKCRRSSGSGGAPARRALSPASARRRGRWRPPAPPGGAGWGRSRGGAPAPAAARPAPVVGRAGGVTHARPPARPPARTRVRLQGASVRTPAALPPPPPPPPQKKKKTPSPTPSQRHPLNNKTTPTALTSKRSAFRISVRPSLPASAAASLTSSASCAPEKRLRGNERGGWVGVEVTSAVVRTGRQGRQPGWELGSGVAAPESASAARAPPAPGLKGKLPQVYVVSVRPPPEVHLRARGRGGGAPGRQGHGQAAQAPGSGWRSPPARHARDLLAALAA